MEHRPVLKHVVDSYDESNLQRASRRAIIESSLVLFVEQGLPHVTMIDIAKACGISRRKLYYYYQTMEDLAIDVQLHCLFDIFLAYELSDDKSAYELLDDYLCAAESTIRDHPTEFKFITAFDYYYPDGFPGAAYNQKGRKLFLEAEAPLVTIMRRGLVDGSIHVGDDVVHYGLTVQRLFLAYVQQVTYRAAALGKTRPAYCGDVPLVRKLILRALEKTPEKNA